jgi:urease gamma subunit
MSKYLKMLLMIIVLCGMVMQDRALAIKLNKENVFDAINGTLTRPITKKGKSKTEKVGLGDLIVTMNKDTDGVKQLINHVEKHCTSGSNINAAPGNPAARNHTTIGQGRVVSKYWLKEVLNKANSENTNLVRNNAGITITVIGLKVRDIFSNAAQATVEVYADPNDLTTKKELDPKDSLNSDITCYINLTNEYQLRHNQNNNDYAGDAGTCFVYATKR